MSRGKRNQSKHVHVNKYAQFSHAGDAQARIQRESEKELQAQAEKDRREGRGMGSFGMGFSSRRGWLYHNNSEPTGRLYEFGFQREDYNPSSR